MPKLMDFTFIKHDINGNPRAVCHMLSFLTDEELSRTGAEWIPITEKYRIAIQRAHLIGGRKFHNKQFGGGIVFQCYSEDELRKSIADLLTHVQPVPFKSQR